MKATALFRTFSKLPTVSFLVLVFSTVVVGQSQKVNDGMGNTEQSLVFSRTANVTAGTNLLLQIESPVFNDIRSEGKPTGTLQVSLLDMLQMEVTNEASIARADGDIQPLMMWGMKCLVYQSETKETSVSAIITSSLEAGSGDLELRRSDSTLQSTYGYRSVSLGFLGSHEFSDQSWFHCGIEVRQLVASFERSVPFNRQSYQESQPVHGWRVHGFAGISVQAWKRFLEVAEIQSIP